MHAHAQGGTRPRVCLRICVGLRVRVDVHVLRGEAAVHQPAGVQVRQRAQQRAQQVQQLPRGRVFGEGSDD
jgi:hypothetical protein